MAHKSRKPVSNYTWQSYTPRYTYLGYPLPTHHKGQPLPNRWIYKYFEDHFQNYAPLTIPNLELATWNLKHEALNIVKTIEGDCRHHFNHPQTDVLDTLENDNLFRRDRNKFMRQCDIVILVDSRLSREYRVEEILYNTGYKNLIEKIKPLLKVDNLFIQTRAKNILRGILHEGIAFYGKLLNRWLASRYIEDLDNEYRINPDEVKRLNKFSKWSLVKLLVSFGDLYLHKAEHIDNQVEKRVDCEQAADYYDIALYILPNGAPKEEDNVIRERILTALYMRDHVFNDVEENNSAKRRRIKSFDDEAENNSVRGRRRIQSF